MTKITILSGFGQEPQTFKNVFSNKDVIAFDYFQTKNFENLLTRDLTAYDNEVVIGWSLGGQVAIRLIEKQILKSKLLILIATPFQFVRNNKNNTGVNKEDFESFKINLALNPKQTLQYLACMSGNSDENSAETIKNMEGINNVENLSNWFQELKDFTCFDIDFKNFPKTVYICGDSDAVVDISQYKYFQERIADFELQIMFNCGHAPHFSHKNEFLNIINEKI